MRAGEGWAARRCLARVWVSRLRDSSPVCGLMSPDQYNNCAALHCDTLHHQHQCYPLCCCCIIKISVQATMSPLISAGLWAAVAGLGWAGRALAGIFIELIRECWAYLIVYDGVQCLGRLLPRPALRLSANQVYLLTCFIVASLQAGAGARGRWHLNMDILTVSHK